MAGRKRRGADPKRPGCTFMLKDGSECRTYRVELEDGSLSPYCRFHTTQLLAESQAPPEPEPEPEVVDAEPVVEALDQTGDPLQPWELRERLAKDLAGSYPELVGSLRELATGEKPHRVTCKFCSRHFDVTLPDVQARTSALRLLLEHGLGRPGQSEETSTLERTAAELPTGDMNEWSDAELNMFLAQSYAENPEELKDEKARVTVIRELATALTAKRGMSRESIERIWQQRELYAGMAELVTQVIAEAEASEKRAKGNGK